MTAALLTITLRALLGRRRTLLLGLVGALLVLATVLYRISNPGESESLVVVHGILGDFGLGVLLPLVAVIVATAAIGSELDDGTIVYLLAKPIRRWHIVLVKLVVTWLLVVLLTVPAIVVAGLIGHPDPGPAVGYGVAAALAALEYSAVFLALSLVTSRALIIGLAYVVVWEGVVAGLFAGTRALSIRQHALALAEWLSGDEVTGSDLVLGAAVSVALAVSVLATAIAVRRLERVELRGETA